MKPKILQSLSEEKVVELDVRPIFDRGEEPFQPIMTAVAKTQADGAMKLHAPFKPGPLISLLGSQGWSHWIERGESDHWVIWFYRASSNLMALIERSIQRFPELNERLKSEANTLFLDVRGLAPPQPLELTLAMVDELPSGCRLLHLNERMPHLLFPILEERGIPYKVISESSADVQVEIIPVVR